MYVQCIFKAYAVTARLHPDYPCCSSICHEPASAVHALIVLGLMLQRKLQLAKGLCSRYLRMVETARREAELRLRLSYVPANDGHLLYQPNPDSDCQLVFWDAHVIIHCEALLMCSCVSYNIHVGYM